MSRVMPPSLLFLLALWSPGASPAGAETGPRPASDALMEVIPDRLDGNRGRLRCLAFTRPAGFPGSPRLAIARAEASAASGHPRCVFRGLPAGPLAISVIHDADLSGDLTTNVLGIPIEGYGFSRDARGTFAPPAFEQAAFDHDGGHRTLRVRLSY